MSFKQYIKRGIRFVVKGIPTKVVNVKVAEIAPNEMLKGRTALVTGGTSGIGFEIAKAYLKSGAKVIITGRNEERIQKACEELKRHGEIHGIRLDNCDVPSFSQKLKDILQIDGVSQLDILVNNAGVLGGEISHATEDVYDKILDTNLKGVFFLSQMFGRYFKENGIQGNILNIASSSSLRPAASAYTVSKWGLRGLTLGLAKCFAPYGITVNGLAPGPTATPMTMYGDRSNIVFEKNPIGRYAMPQEIANMAVFLVSDMGRTIVGDIIYMTGGAGLVTLDDVGYGF